MVLGSEKKKGKVKVGWSDCSLRGGAVYLYVALLFCCDAGKDGLFSAGGRACYHSTEVRVDAMQAAEIPVGGAL
jgi:hypothetical protein